MDPAEASVSTPGDSLVSRLRAKFVRLSRILNSWCRSYSRSLRSIIGIKKRRRPKPCSAAQPKCVAVCRLRSFRCSNSFYAEAIADCLYFIKTSTVSTSIDAAAC